MTNTILTPGLESDLETQDAIEPVQNYLLKDNYLSEYADNVDSQTAVRSNIGVLAADDTYTKEKVEEVIVDKINAKIKEYSSTLDYITLDLITDLLSEFVRIDGSTPFTNTLKGVTPQSNQDLTTKLYVDKLIDLCLKLDSKDEILEEVATVLKDYVLLSDVYFKNEVYTKKEVNQSLSKYVKRDGTTSFTAPLSGVTPQIGSHLTTKKYVDDQIYNHKTDIDPHGYVSLLSTKLKKYALKDNVLDKTQTYTRGQINDIIDKLVTSSVSEVMDGYLTLEDPHDIINKVKALGYVTKNGTIPFTSPQKGVPAENNNELVTLQLVKNIAESLETEWITSGPVEATVGLVEQGSIFNDVVTILEVMDAIFYGKAISIISPELGFVGKTVEVTACVRGDLAQLDYGQIYLNGELLITISKSDFEDSNCITFESFPITEDTEFVFKVVYLNGSYHETSSITKLSLPVFIGTLPKWKNGSTVTYDYLVELINEDSNNQFYCGSKDLEKLDHKYNFKDTQLRHPFIAVPVDYPDLYQMCTPSQLFGIEAFDIVDIIPMQVPGAEKDVMYKLYIYSEALVLLNIPVYFTFN